MGMNVLNNSGGINSDPTGGDRPVAFTENARNIVRMCLNNGNMIGTKKVGSNLEKSTLCNC